MSRGRYAKLAYVVQYRDTNQPWYESICAFNSDAVALIYAKDCRKSALLSGAVQGFGVRYRVVDWSRRKERVLWESAE